MLIRFASAPLGVFPTARGQPLQEDLEIHFVRVLLRERGGGCFAAPVVLPCLPGIAFTGQHRLRLARGQPRVAFQRIAAFGGETQQIVAQRRRRVRELFVQHAEHMAA